MHRRVGIERTNCRVQVDSALLCHDDSHIFKSKDNCKGCPNTYIYGKFIYKICNIKNSLNIRFRDRIFRLSLFTLNSTAFKTFTRINCNIVTVQTKRAEFGFSIIIVSNSCKMEYNLLH